MQSLLTFIDRLVPQKAHGKDESLRKGRLLVISCFMVVGLCAMYAIFYLSVDYWVGFFNCIYAGSSALFLLFHFRSKGRFVFAGNFFSFSAFVFFTLFTLTTYGLGTAIAAWFMIVPVMAFLIANVRSGIFWSVVVLLAIAALYVVEKFGFLPASYLDPAYINEVNLVALLGLFTYIVLIIFSYETGKAEVMARLQSAKNKIEQQNAAYLEINQQLENIVAERTKHLETAKGELDTFLYESSHALRRPLVRIIGLLQLLSMELPEKERQSYRDHVHFTASTMDRMLHDLLHVSEIENREVRIRPIRLRQELDSILLEAKNNHDTDNTDIRIDVPEELSIGADTVLLRILLGKLIDNALTYRKIDGSRHEVLISTQSAAAGVALEIRDNGIGIDPRALPDIYDMFVRGTEKYTGNGLGLFIAARASNKMAIPIQLKSEQGVYTSFRLLIPSSTEHQ